MSTLKEDILEYCEGIEDEFNSDDLSKDIDGILKKHILYIVAEHKGKSSPDDLEQSLLFGVNHQIEKNKQKIIQIETKEVEHDELLVDRTRYRLGVLKKESMGDLGDFE